MRKTTILLIISILAVLSACNNNKTETKTEQPTAVVENTAAAPADSPERLHAALKAAFAQKNAQQLEALLAPSVTDGFSDGGAYCGAGCPPAQFIAKRLGEDTNFWANFDHAVKSGFGPAGRDTLVAPAYADKLDAGNLAFVNGTNVNVRATASTKGPVLTQLSETLVELAIKKVYNEVVGEKIDEYIRVEAEGKEWAQVVLPNKQKGYIALDFLAFNGSVNAVYATKVGGQWKIYAMLDHAWVCAL